MPAFFKENRPTLPTAPGMEKSVLFALPGEHGTTLVYVVIEEQRKDDLDWHGHLLSR